MVAVDQMLVVEGDANDALRDQVSNSRSIRSVRQASMTQAATRRVRSMTRSTAPRGRGEILPNRPRREAGPSPRGRGSLDGAEDGAVVVGFIPAWEGEPARSSGRSPATRVHPRVGGGAKLVLDVTSLDEGPSPRGRGSHRLGRNAPPGFGSIPTWAGEPTRTTVCPAACRVHPRVGGGARMTRRWRLLTPGPSPRGRGSLLVTRDLHRMSGSIPAWAGEPGASLALHSSVRVHPRVGGGARDTARS